MKRLLMFATVAALVVAGARCPKAADDYYPLSVGSTWNTEGYVLYGTTAAALDTMRTMATHSKVERKAQLVAGGDVFEMVSHATIHVRFPFDTTYTVTDTSYVQETASALLGYEALDDTAPDTMAVLPLSAGKTWRVSPNTTAEAVGQEDLTVRAGAFTKVWKIKMTTTDGSETIEAFMFFANHVGHVRTYWEMEPTPGYRSVFNEELVSYTIK